MREANGSAAEGVRVGAGEEGGGGEGERGRLHYFTLREDRGGRRRAVRLHTCSLDG